VRKSRIRIKTWLTITALACCSVLCTGCFWLAVGGAGAVGYEVAKDDRTIGTKLDDASITSGVKTKLIKDSEIHAANINVDTFEGVVTLHGDVPSSGAKRRAANLAKSVKGVKSVRSKLVVVSPPD
jgi:osmotically-inducible protein OsmY